MANLYRKPVVVTDPQAGEKIKIQSKKWWGQFKDANGRLRRHPLAVDKMAAQAILNKLVKRVEREKAGLVDPTEERVEREKAGLVDPTEEQRKWPLSVHVADFKSYQENKNLTAKQIKETHSQLQKIIAACKWQRITDVSAGGVMDCRRSVPRHRKFTAEVLGEASDNRLVEQVGLFRRPEPFPV